MLVIAGQESVIIYVYIMIRIRSRIHDLILPKILRSAMMYMYTNSALYNITQYKNSIISQHLWVTNDKPHPLHLTCVGDITMSVSNLSHLVSNGVYWSESLVKEFYWLMKMK